MRKERITTTMTRATIVVQVILFTAFFLVDTGCGQRSLRDITNSDTVKVRFEWMYRDGPTSTFIVSLTDIPKAPAIPSAYTLVEDNIFLVRSKAVVSGDNVATVKVKANNESDFAGFKLLRLTENDMLPEGMEWQDCTITPRSATADINPDDLAANERIANAYNEKMRNFMPNLSNKVLSCDLGGYSGEGDVYFMLSKQSSAPPTQAFTKIEISEKQVPNSNASPETIYRLQVGNAGNITAAEVNLRSDFGSDTKIVSVSPSQGQCVAAKWGSSYGSEVCHLGQLRPGEVATIDFIASPSGMSGGLGPVKQNQSWSITGASKEHSNDPQWAVNWFRFEPFRTNSSSSLKNE
jgi:hypothetical protein